MGRNAELAELTKLTADCPLVTLVAPGGCGKTRLAAEALDRESSRATWVDLAALPFNADAAAVAAALTAALDLPARPGVHPAAQIAGTLGGAGVLVADNAEHVVSGLAGLLDEVLAVRDDVRILVTSQEPLRIDGERVLRVRPLPREDAVRLFRERAAAAGGDAEIHATTDDDIAALCDRLDRIPLAIELAAASVPELGPAGLTERLDDRFAVLTAGSRSGATRHTTLEKSIRWSVDRLTDQERGALVALSTFAGGFTLDAAAAVADADAGTVATLVRKSLAEHIDDDRYRLYESVRLFAIADEGDARRRHCDWCVAMVRRHGGAVGGPAERAAFEEFDAEAGNISAALRWALTDGNDTAAGVEMVESLGRYWYLRGRLDEAMQWIGAALVVVPAERRGAVAALAGTVLHALGRTGESVARFEEALAAARASGDLGAEARALHGLAQNAVLRGDYATGQPLLRDAAEKAATAGDVEASISALNTAAATAALRGDLDEVRRVAGTCVNHARGAGHQRGEATALLHLATADRLSGDAASAEANLEQSLHLAREAKMPVVVASVLGTLGSLAMDRGEFDEADRLYGESVAVASGIGDSRLMLISQMNLGEVARLRGDLERARPAFAEVVATARRIGDRRAMAAAQTTLADIARVSGDVSGAASLARRSLETLRELGDRRVLLGALDTAAFVLHARGDVEVAAELVSAATAGFADAGIQREPDARACVDAVVEAVGAGKLAGALARGRDMGVPAAVEHAIAALTGRHRPAVDIDTPGTGPAPSATVDADVEVRVLGGFAVSHRGQPVAANAWQSKKARDLLKLLVAHRGRPVPREQLIEALWPDDEPGAAANRFRVALSTVRTVLDPQRARPTDHFVRSEGNALVLDTDRVAVDVERFLAAVNAGEYAVAESLYVGDVLPEDRYEDWTIALREQARLGYLTAASALARTAVAAGDDERAAALHLRLLDLDPYDERAHQGLVEALLRLGRHGDARRAHAFYRDRMAELGVDVPEEPPTARR